jgi:Domain of unknown function (DUF4386)
MTAGSPGWRLRNPVVKRQNEGTALGFVAARVLEASMIFTGVVSLLSLVTLRQHLGAAAGAYTASLVIYRHCCDDPLSPRPHARHQRTAAGLLDVPIPPRAPSHPP